MHVFEQLVAIISSLFNKCLGILSHWLLGSAQPVIGPVPLELLYKYFIFATKCFDENKTPNPKHTRP